MIDVPLYDIGDVLYLKESAAIGFMEAVQISGIIRTPFGWVYTITARSSRPTSQSYIGDRISAVHGSILYFTENEFILVCDAQALVEANLQARLTQIQAQRAALCSDDITAG